MRFELRARFFSMMSICLVFTGLNEASAAQTLESFRSEAFPASTHSVALQDGMGTLAAARGQAQLGFVFETEEVIASRGFSGKPLNLFIAINPNGLIIDVEIAEHHEPILAIGVKSESLSDFTSSFIGRSVVDPVRVTRGSSSGPDEIAAVVGATVSSIVLSDTILRSARAVARRHGIIDPGDLNLDAFEPLSWNELHKRGLIAQRTVHYKDVRLLLAGVDAQFYPEGVAAPTDEALFIDLFVGLATPAMVGRNLLGDVAYNRLVADLTEGEHLIFVAANGSYSFKGTRWRGQGDFDRLRIVQDDTQLEFTKSDHIFPDSLKIGGAPTLREVAIFKVSAKHDFNASQDWIFDLMVSGHRGDGSRAVVQIPVPFALSDALKSPEVQDIALALPASTLWREVWLSRKFDIAFLLLFLGALSFVLVFQDWVASRRQIYERLRLGFLIVSLLWLGWYTGAQLSILNVLAFMEALRGDFQWDQFLLEPLIFILWAFVAMTMLFFGRGVYCGWLCPFGALQELLSSIAKLIRIPQLELPFPVHERLWPIKYLIAIGLFAMSLGGIEWLTQAAEVEPFKTAIVLRFMREWQFVLYALVLLGFGLFIPRFYCRYLCPLGGALAIPARLRMFDWLRRRPQCGSQCSICMSNCLVEAINPEGNINPNECIHCLACQISYFDANECPPLIKRRKRQEKLIASTPPGPLVPRARVGNEGDR